MDESQKQTLTQPESTFDIAERGEMTEAQVVAMLNNLVGQMTKRDYDWKNPETHPIRYYEVMEKIFSFMDDMSTEELIGATKVVGCLSDYFWDAHFEKQGRFNQKALVKTFDEIKENLQETIYHRENPSLKEEMVEDAANNSPTTE
jgi:hypothetical protein